MNCPYCKSDDVTLIGIPKAALLVALGPALGLGVLSMIAAAALAYKATGKLIYKCNECGKYFIA